MSSHIHSSSQRVHELPSDDLFLNKDKFDVDTKNQSGSQQQHSNINEDAMEIDRYISNFLSTI